jgi:peptidyl-prolyl cis-trans isomerase B (cyclophilin B)
VKIRLYLVAILLVGAAAALIVIGFNRIGRETQVAEDVPNPIATIVMANGDTIKLELYPRVAPNTVANFVTLAQQGFYDEKIFHRVIPGFVIQGGDPTGTGTGGPGYQIRGEFAANGFENGLAHERGVVSMARANDYDSAGSQFFIMHQTGGALDGQYAAFGKVIEGMDAVDRIANTPTDSSDRPLVDARMSSVAVDTFGYQYTVVKIEEVSN